jgi:hypothetical protein
VRTLFLILVLASHVALAAPSQSFVLFDGLLYSDKPDLRRLGMVPIAWVGDLWSKGVSKDTVDEAQVRSLFEPVGKKKEFYYLDIENWPLESVSRSVRQENLNKLMRVIDTARQTAPNAHLGFYGILPGIAYWPLLRHDAAFRAWLDLNREVDPLATHVDAVFPSLYAFNEDLEAWKTYARQTLAEARRYGKPVYAFLWPEFHDSTALRGKEVPQAYWRAELDLCAELADGVVLWGGWQRKWNGAAPWWLETQSFMRERAAKTSTH